MIYSDLVGMLSESEVEDVSHVVVVKLDSRAKR